MSLYYENNNIDIESSKHRNQNESSPKQRMTSKLNASTPDPVLLSPSDFIKSPKKCIALSNFETGSSISEIPFVPIESPSDKNPAPIKSGSEEVPVVFNSVSPFLMTQKLNINKGVISLDENFVHEKNNAYNSTRNPSFKQPLDVIGQIQEKTDDSPPNVLSHDELPVKSLLGTNKTFEQLLEEELKKDSLDNKNKANNSSMKNNRHYLKKGEGTTRFGKSVFNSLNVSDKNKTKNKLPTPKKPASQLTNSSNSKNSVVTRDFSASHLKNSSNSKSSMVSRDISSSQLSSIHSSEISREKTDQDNVSEITDSVGEISFQNKMIELQHKEEVENDELEEFDILEHYADNNASFFSDISTVNKVVARDKQLKTSSTGNVLTASNLIPKTTSSTVEAPLSFPDSLQASSTISGSTDVVEDSKLSDTVCSNSDSDPVDLDKTLEGNQRVSFEDENSWGSDSSDSDSIVSDAKVSKSPCRRIISKKSNINDFNKEIDAIKSPPPVSSLVTKLFPKLKPVSSEKEKSQPPSNNEMKLSSASDNQIGNGIQSKLLSSKLNELEQEIQKFRHENSLLKKLRSEREQELSHLRKEMEEFDKQKNEELKRLQEFKEEETKKLKRERKQFELHQKTVRSMPDKRSREEIDQLKTQLDEMKDELRRKESRWHATIKRLNDKLSSSETQNKQYRDEIKALENQRLAAWKQQINKETTKANNLEKNKASSRKRQTDEKTSKSINQPLRNASPIPVPNLSNELTEDTSLRLSNDFESSPFDLSTSEQKSLSDIDDSVIASEQKSSVPRKTAVALNISGCIDKGDQQFEEHQYSDGKVEKIFSNGAREILFSNGTRKQISSDGQYIIVSFFNGDLKQIMPDQRVVYYYSDAKTTHTTYPDGLEILQFKSGQVEKHYPDGTKEITFPDQTIKYLFPSGIEESIFPDGTVIRIDQSGDKTLEFASGQREIHTKHYKKREYPDGTTKTIYPDGRQETHYSTGRIRVKDKNGQVIADNEVGI